MKQNFSEVIKNLLEKANISYTLIPLPEELPLDIASHVVFHKINLQDAVPTLLYRTEKGIVALQRRADTRFDKEKVKKILGVTSLTFATEEDLQSLNTEKGVVPLVGLSVPYFIDQKVLEQNIIYGGSGVKTLALKLTAQDLVKANNAEVVDITEDKREGKKRLMTGFTPTGKLHLGHFVGNLENLMKLKQDYDSFLLLADTHALTTLHATPEVIRQHTLDVLLDLLSVGLSESEVTYYVESDITEIYELSSLFSMYVSHNRALRNPTIKDEIKMKNLGDQFSLGFINYPIFQAADILCVRGELVPVGIDQEAHLEQSREIARTFNTLAKKEIFPEPKALIGRVGKLIGTDGNPKMSKSLGNTIFLSATEEEVEKKVMSMYTDPTRLKATDPGHVEGNPLFIYLDAFGSGDDAEQIGEYKKLYTEGKVGDVEVKKYLIKVVNNFLNPIREQRAFYSDEKKLLTILQKGNDRVREESKKVLEDVKEALHFVY